MTTLRTITTVGFGPVITPDGDPLVGAVVTFTLSGSTGKPLASVDVNSDETVVKIVTATTDASGDFSVSLIPNDRIADDTYYRVDIADADFEPVVNKLATGVGSVSFADFISTGALPADVSAFTAHIQDAAIHQSPSVGAYSNLKTSTNVTNPTIQVDATADNITLSDTNGLPLQATAVAVTADITATGANGRDSAIAEKSGEHYQLFVIGKPDGSIASLLKQWRTSGTTTATTANKLVDSGGLFSTDGLVEVGDVAINKTGGTSTTVSAIDSDTTLSVADDIFVSGDEYQVVLDRDPAMPTGYTYKRRVGSVFNDSSSNFRAFRQAGRKIWINSYSQELFLSGGASTAWSLVSPEVPPSAVSANIIEKGASGNAHVQYSLDASTIHTRRFAWFNVYLTLELSLTSFQQIYYMVGSNSIDLYLYGYEDNL